MPNLNSGYNPNFLLNNIIKDTVGLPILGASHASDIAPVAGNYNSIANYTNYSLQLSASRKFPFFAAANIDGAQNKKVSRKKSWKKDDRAIAFQWGAELYSAVGSEFDKGHMAKCEDLQWGATPEIAKLSSDSTFYYSNAVPQHKKLNRVIWKDLEYYILHSEAIKKSLKICVFTGPVLLEDDPAFVTPVDGVSVLIPIFFWKVVVFPKADGRLYRVGFMMCQKQLLSNSGIVVEPRARLVDDNLFLKFKNAKTYQVNVKHIEQLADIQFPKVIDLYEGDDKIELVMKRVDIDRKGADLLGGKAKGYRIENLVI